MQDHSYLDKKYFIDNTVYNCPYCNRNNVPYSVDGIKEFNWSNEKPCWVLFIKCSYCSNISMHSSFVEIAQYGVFGTGYKHFRINPEYAQALDENIFHSQPTSFFVIDNRVPRIIRELITEAEGCLKLNFLTGASACMRKAIYELLVKEKAEGTDYESKIKNLKKKYPSVDPIYFDILAQIQDMTSEKVHEQSWDKWESKYLKLIIETLKSVLYEIYVLPKEKAERTSLIQNLREMISSDKKRA